MERHFFKCRLCLTPWTEEFNEDPLVQRYGNAFSKLTTCPFCESLLEKPPVRFYSYMGKVHREHLEKQAGERSACDARCTNALGPSCDCQCGGENHGTNLTVAVIQSSAVPSKISPEKAMERKNEYLKALEEAQAIFFDRYQKTWEDKRAGRFVPGGLYYPMMTHWHTLSEAKKSQSHPTRMKKLNDLLQLLRTSA